MSEQRANIGHSMKEIYLYLRRDLDSTLKPLSVSYAQLRALALLSHHDSPLSPAELGRLCRVTPQAMQVLLSGLVKNKWIARQKHATNDQILQLHLTKEGERILEQATPVQDKVFERMLKGFSASEIDAMDDLLDRCLGNLQRSQARRHIR